jgi:DNA polymerase/3'-5' exonuclease PolX
MGMAVLPSGTKMRHIDIIETTREEFPFTSLYFTGSANWNIKMRHRANECGLRLNEHNYTHTKTGKAVSEKEYQAKLGKPYPETE